MGISTGLASQHITCASTRFVEQLGKLRVGRHVKIKAGANERFNSAVNIFGQDGFDTVCDPVYLNRIKSKIRARGSYNVPCVRTDVMCFVCPIRDHRPRSSNDQLYGAREVSHLYRRSCRGIFLAVTTHTRVFECATKRCTETWCVFRST